MVLFIDGGDWRSVSVGESVASYLGPKRNDVVCWKGGYCEAGRKLNKLELVSVENVVVFVHLSICFDYSVQPEDWMDKFDICDIVRLIRETNPEARVVVYSGEMDLPVQMVVGELKADGYILLPGDIECWNYFVNRGRVSEEEMRERGKTVDVFGGGRYNPEGLNMRYGCVERDRTGD